MVDYGSLDHRALSFAAEIRLVFHINELIYCIFSQLSCYLFHRLCFAFGKPRAVSEGISICLLFFSIHLSISALLLFTVPPPHIIRYCQFITFPLFVVRARKFRESASAQVCLLVLIKLLSAFIFCSRTHTCMNFLLSLLSDVRSRFSSLVSSSTSPCSSTLFFLSFSPHFSSCATLLHAHGHSRAKHTRALKRCRIFWRPS